jgi:hypothetical protein
MALNFTCGSWPPQGNEIVFSALVPSDNRATIWVVHSDGTGLRQVRSGMRRPLFALNLDRLLRPELVPDSKKIVFGRRLNLRHRRLHANANGSGPFQVTHTPDINERGGDWGTLPLTP